MAHTAGSGRRVPEEAIRFWSQIEELARRHNVGQERLFDTLDPSLRRIVTSDNGLAEQVEMSIGLRLPLGVNADELVALLRAGAGEATVAFHGLEQPFVAPKRSPLVSAFTSAIRAEGSRAALVLKTGTSDMNVVGPIWEVPIVAYGPGDSSLDHTPDEHIEIDEYLRAIAVLVRVLQRLAAATATA